MGRIKNYYKDFKENLKIEMDEDKESKNNKDEIADSQIMDELKKEFTEEKKEKFIMVGAVTGLLIVVGLIISILYICFNKPIKKMANDFINKIPVYNSQNNNGNNTNTNDTNTNTNTNNNDNNNNNSSTGCTSPFDAKYILNNEELDFSSDGSYTKYIGDEFDNFGKYSIDNGTITVTIDLGEDGTMKISYKITKDCSKVTESSNGKVYQKQ